MEGDHGGKVRICQRGISIHSLRMEGDHTKYKLVYMQTLISIHSLRMEGDTFAWMRENGYLIISIHSLRMEGDHRSR